MRTLAVVTLCLCTGMAQAEAPLSAEAFDALTLGRTMTWAEFGQVYGVEQYLPDRRVRWTVLGDDCKTGHWYAEGPAICFLYDDQLNPVCWEVTQSGTGLLAHHTASPPNAAPVVIVESSTPMACFGPEVGA